MGEVILNPWVRMLTCKSCKLVIALQVTRREENPPIGLPVLKYCPVCGGTDVTMPTDTYQDCWWEQMALHYGLPQALIRELWATWKTSTHESFSDYVAYVLQEMASANSNG